jgi:ATP-dependent Lon protease
MIALGGISDGSLLDGHDYTYEGSKWGRLVQCLMDAKCMDPVIYFDELDKVSESTDGQEIIGILTHLVDFTQNDKIQDRYFNGIDLDFSNCIFIFSFNDESKINNVLKDRIQIFYTKGFCEEEKIKIATDYLLPQICQNFIFSHTEISFSADAISHIINKHTKNEEGIREVKKNWN